MSASFDYDVIIAGGGPAGSSAAILLAAGGARVLVIEQKKFPRPKLCGEFISPECLSLFERLGVGAHMQAARPAALTETVFYSRSGHAVRVPSSWFGASAPALGLSRAEMDEILLRRAEAAGARVYEGATVSGVITTGGRVIGVKIKPALQLDETVCYAPVTIDATGRARVLTRRLAESKVRKLTRPTIVAFKAHLESTRVAPGTCEIYFYRRGYGGLSTVENGTSNLCFIASASDVRACDADADRVMREVVCRNLRAESTLKNARLASPWLAVSLEKFGRQSIASAPGLLAIGDAASFIDPFTGSGILMALQSGELAAGLILKFLEQHASEPALAELTSSYRTAYRQIFDSRLRVSSLMRRAAFVSGFANLGILLFSRSEGLRQRLTHATRGGVSETCSLANRPR